MYVTLISSIMSIYLYQLQLVDNNSKILLWVDCGSEILLYGDCDCTPKVVKQEDVGDVELGYEPPVVLRPIQHGGVAGEEGVLGELPLLGALSNCQDVAGEDDVSTAGVLGVELVLPAVGALGQGHGDAGPGVRPQVVETDLPRGGIDVWHTTALVCRTVAKAENIGKGEANDGVPDGDGGHGAPVRLVADIASHPGMLVVWRWSSCLHFHGYLLGCVGAAYRVFLHKDVKHRV